MKESASGDDEVTINVVRMASEQAQRAIQKLVCDMFEHMSEWDEVPTRAVVILLWIQKGRRSHLAHYRGIVLFSIASD